MIVEFVSESLEGRENRRSGSEVRGGAELPSAMFVSQKLGSGSCAEIREMNGLSRAAFGRSLRTIYIKTCCGQGGV